MKILKRYWLALIIIGGIALRYYHNLDISLWHDEAFSALYLKYPWGEMMYRIGLDVHPPLYYIALRLWHYLFGDSLLSLRSFSVLFGAAIIPLAYIFVKQAFHNRKAAVIVALLTAVNPFQLEYVTEVRMYTFGAFFALLAAHLLIKALATQKAYFESANLSTPNLPETKLLRNTMLWQYFGFALSVSAIMYTHYYLFFTAAALGLYGLWFQWHTYKDSFKKYWPLIFSFTVIGIFYVPWIPTFFFQFGQVSDSYWIPKMTVWSIPTTVWQMLLAFGIDIAKQSTQFYVSLATLFSLLFLGWLLYRTSEKAKWLLILTILAPFAGALLFALLGKLRGAESSVFLVRYFLFASVFYTVALGIWFSEIPWKKFGYLLLACYVGINLVSFAQHWQDLNLSSRPGMAAASKYLQQNVKANDKIIVGSSFEFFNYKYYNQTPVIPVLYSGGNRDIKNLPHFAGTAILTNEDLFPDFSEGSASGDTIWLLWTNGFGGTKPEVPANFEEVEERGYEDVRPYPGTWIVVTKYLVH